MRRGWLVVIAVAVLAGCGGGGEEPEPAREGAGVFMTRLVRDVAAGNYERAWEGLHPAHKRVAPRAQYLECERRDHVESTVAEIAVLRIEDQDVGVAGEPGTSLGAAVTLRLRFGPDDDVTDTFHAVALYRDWVWILPRERYEAYRAGRCP